MKKITILLLILVTTLALHAQVAIIKTKKNNSLQEMWTLLAEPLFVKTSVFSE
jgi:hypothetical protein